ncbi:hypothetical protein ABPG74_010687 [Tetrahymena malaccensis]
MEIYKAIRKQPCKWSLNDTLQWLELIGMKQYQQTFRDNSVDGSILMDLSEQDLINELQITDENDKNEILKRLREEMPKIKAIHKEKEDFQKYKIEKINFNTQNKQEISDETLKELKLKFNIPNDWEICNDKKDWGYVITDEESYYLSIYRFESKDDVLIQVKDTINQCDLSIGQDSAQNQISADHKYLDSVHAKIVFDNIEKVYWFIDCNTQYGSYVRMNGNKISILDEYIIGNSVIKINKITRNEKDTSSVQLDFSLVTEKGVTTNLTIQVSKGIQKWIGRDSTCDILLDDMEVSKKHAYLSMNQDEVFIYDNNSKNKLWKRVNSIKFNNSQEPSLETIQMKLGREKFSFLVYKQKKQKYYKELHDYLK